MFELNLTQFHSKKTAICCLAIYYTHGILHGDYDVAYNSDTGFWELRKV